VLGQGESSRLNVGVVRREKAAVATGSEQNPYGSRNGPGVWTVYGIVNQGVSAERLDSLLGIQLDSIRTNGITAAELEKAKNVAQAGFIANRETTYGKAEELQHYRTFHASIDEINTDLDKLLAVTGDDVKRVAATYLDPAGLTW
jgi:predicted Zn-dependent peptidase